MIDLQKDLEQACANALKRGVEPREIMGELLTLSAAAAYMAGADSGEVLRKIQRELDNVLELSAKLRDMGGQLVIGFKDLES